MKDEDRLRIEGYDHEIQRCEETVRRCRESEAEYLAAHPEIGKGLGRIRLAANLLFAAMLIIGFFLLAIFLPVGVFFLAAILPARILFARKYRDTYLAKYFPRELGEQKRQSEEQSRLAAQLRHEKEMFIRSLR